MEIKTYTITEAVNAGFSRLVRDAEEEGVVIFKRDGKPVTMMVSLESNGYLKFLRSFQEITSKDIATQSVPENMISMVYLMKGLVSIQEDFLRKMKIDQEQPKLDL